MEKSYAIFHDDFGILRWFGQYLAVSILMPEKWRREDHKFVLVLKIFREIKVCFDSIAVGHKTQ